MRAGLSLHAFDRYLQLSARDDRRRRADFARRPAIRNLIERAVPHLITRDPKEFWTAGQWMTELTGGSDVGLSETIAKEDGLDSFVCMDASGSRPQSVRKWR